MLAEKRAGFRHAKTILSMHVAQFFSDDASLFFEKQVLIVLGSLDTELVFVRTSNRKSQTEEPRGKTAQRVPPLLTTIGKPQAHV